MGDQQDEQPRIIQIMPATRGWHVSCELPGQPGERAGAYYTEILGWALMSDGTVRPLAADGGAVVVEGGDILTPVESWRYRIGKQEPPPGDDDWEFCALSLGRDETLTMWRQKVDGRLPQKPSL